MKKGVNVKLSIGDISDNGIEEFANMVRKWSERVDNW